MTTVIVFGVSTDTLCPRKRFGLKVYCRSKSAVGSVRKPRIQTTWFEKLGLWAKTYGHWVITVIFYIVSDFSVSCVVARRAVTLYCD